jgi:hypothetical protein
MTLPALHIFIDARKRVIERVLQDQGDQKNLTRVEKYNAQQGLTRLHRVVVCEGEVRVVPPGDEG